MTGPRRITTWPPEPRFPDGRRRAVFFCAARAPACPRCATPVRRVSIDNGSVFCHCEGRPQLQPGQVHRRQDQGRCGQHFHILGIRGGLCVVVELSREEYDRHSRLPPETAFDLYADLQVVVVET